jgi:hypothetical protein
MLSSFKKAINISGLIVLAISFFVYFLSAERTGSLWDCGEFILGAYKLQVVHPPGAGLFILVGRLFTWVAELFSDNPENIAFAVNLMSGLCSAFAAMFIGWSTMLLGKMAMVGRENKTSTSENIALTFAGLVAGLTTAFSTSVWFSAVEGEVYAMSTMFTAFTIWAALKWYHLPNDNQNDRWLIFSIFIAGLSIGIHLLSILAFPTIALLYYFKKYDKHNLKGAFISLALGMLLLIFVMKVIIVGIPTIWKNFELFTVNTLGLPFHSGLVPTLAVLGGLAFYLFRYAARKKNVLMQNLVMVATLLVIGYSTIGVVVVRSNADTPVNMNTPSDVMRLIPYLNREQYGERPLLKGPHYLAQPVNVEREERYGKVGNSYKKVSEKYEYVYRDRDKILFPRIGHSDRIPLHNAWRNYLTGSTSGSPGMAYNMKFLYNYQIGFMYMRYFMWNFTGRQNGSQGIFPWDPRHGHWISGVDAIDEARLYNFDKLPDQVKNDPARNKYYFLPLLFGLIGMFYHYKTRRKDFLATMLLFLIAGLGIIIYSNQPPQEPRERDYVLVGSFITYCIWIGMGVLAIFDVLKSRLNLKGITPAIVAGIIVLSAPIIMGFENFDDHDRSEHYAARDYASNFLNSVDKDAIIFTYGDNDTYPLWYAQEVEGIRRDVRVVNLSLIQVDWYIDKLRNKVNDSPPINLTIGSEGYMGKNLNQIFLPEGPANRPMDLTKLLAAMNKPASQPQWPSKQFVIPVDRNKIQSSTTFDLDSLPLGDIVIQIPEASRYITKDEIAIMDIIASNLYERPIYFAVTCKNEKLLNLNDYMQLEGLSLRVTPVKSRSDRSLAIYGSGRVAADKAYDNIMNKWKWGNFDNYDTHVDNSYLAAVQAMKFTMLRTGMTFLNQGDNVKAAEIANKYFQSFPNMNFRFDAGITPYLSLLIQAGDYESAKTQIQTLTNEVVQEAEFLLSLDNEDLVSFNSELDMALQGLGDAVNYASRVNDSEFESNIMEQVGDLRNQIAGLRGVINQ